MEIKTTLTEIRTKRGIPASQLARRIGVSRQTVYAIEAGDYVPNTAVSLKLAKVLETTVEELFQLESDERLSNDTMEVIILGETEAMKKGQPLRLCEVNGRAIAVAPEIGGWGLPPADAVLVDLPRKTKRHTTAKVQILGDKWKTTSRILLSGCDPGVSILAQSLQAQGCELIVCFENSSRALDLLHEGLVHVAGTHLLDKMTGKTDLLPLTKMFPRNSVAVYAYAMWEEGLVTLAENPKRIHGVVDLVKKGVRFTNREQGAGCRRLLDACIRKAGVSSQQIKGYDNITVGHLAAARMVRDNEADCCVSTRVVARAMSLNFIPLAEKPYHLLIRRSHLNLAPVQMLLQTLGRAAFRREVEASTGYNMRSAGEQLA